MKNKTMRRAMISSIIALVLCFAMLVGTTYAWFTDSVTSANNIIKSGTLNIDLLVKRGTDYVSVRTNDDPIFNYDKWEPGYVAVAWAKVATKGNLALKYTMKIIANGQVSDLADVIDVYYINDDVQPTRAQIAAATPLCTLREALEGGAQFTINDTLIPDAQADAAGYTKYSDPVTIALKMRESAGNEYQNLDIGGTFSFQILATQYTYEEDSFDDQYDANAVYPVASLDGAKAALANGNDVVLSGNVATNVTSAADAISVNGQTLDGNGNTITVTAANNNLFGIEAKSGTVENLTIDGNGTGRGIGGNAAMTGDLEINNVTIDGPLYAINVGNGNGKDITVKDSTINGWSSIAGANTTFEDCTFGEANGYAVFAVHSTTTFINCEFCNGYDMFGRRDASPDGTSSGVLTLTNCTYNGTPVTAQNFQSLFDQSHDIDFNAFLDNMTVFVDGVDARPYITRNN